MIDEVNALQMLNTAHLILIARAKFVATRIPACCLPPVVAPQNHECPACTPIYACPLQRRLLYLNSHLPAQWRLVRVPSLHLISNCSVPLNHVTVVPEAKVRNIWLPCYVASPSGSPNSWFLKIVSPPKTYPWVSLSRGTAALCTMT